MIKCKECGSNIDDSIPGNNATMCFNCSFFLNNYQAKGTIVIDGLMYHIGNETAKYGKGFGGRKFRVKMKDGKIIETTNLNCNGKIPEHFRDRLVDNAISMKAI